MELEYTGIIQTDSMMLMSVRQAGDGPYHTSMSIPGAGYSYESIRPATAVGYTSGDEKHIISMDPGRFLEPFYERATVHQSVTADAYDHASGRVLGPIHGTLDVEATAPEGYGDGTHMELDLTPVIELARDDEYVAQRLVGPYVDGLTGPVRSLRIEGVMPDEVSDAYSDVVRTRSPSSVETLIEALDLHRGRIALSGLHLEWEEQGDASSIGFQPEA
ncbi:MAG: hypothetical protein QF415_16595 [Candidatus Undinarchaeales archaeon]|nr:hypothetical protein [Candidatus Undinarchaeales archaeon]MDP7494674.1 hypothetical protein [Candidatus Undinarchaeales archaeon]